jgi:HD superfamily phosphohydrolase
MTEIRDPIHGFITPSDTELKIINTPVFQRLRKIRQLAMANLIYPGANHTRFEHSLGTYHIASRMAEKLLPGIENEEKRRSIKFAALLHDVGHGSFSHVSETVLDDYSDNLAKNGKGKIHEKITIDIIKNDKELSKLISENDKNTVINLLGKSPVDVALMKNIVSGPLDADKMDYLLRDSYFCGVKYGVFDLDRILNTVESYDDKLDKYIAVKYDGVNSLEQFALAKYYMTMQVYRHKGRCVTDAMIIRGLKLGIEKDEIDFLIELFNYKNTPEYIYNYLKYWDDRILYELAFSRTSGYAHEIFHRLYKRNLFKTVFEERLKNLNLSDKFRDVIINITEKANKNKRSRIEKEISLLPNINCCAENVILNSFTVKSVKEMSSDNEGDIIVISREGNKRCFKEESTVFASIDESMKDIKVEVYATLDNPSLSEKKKQDLRASIRQILEGEKE